MLAKQALARWTGVCVVSAALLAATPVWARTKVPWPEAPYSHYVEDQDLADVLRQFASGFSLALQLGPGVSGKVNGRFNTKTPTEFIDRLSGVYGLNWFAHAGTLYVSRASDVRTVNVRSLEGSISGLRDALSQLGMLDDRFGWGELPDQGVALVSGPDAYVRLIQRTVAALPINNGGQQVAVFRLRHASVNDRVVSYRGKEMTTPGLATILRDLITGSGSDSSQALSSMAAPLRENPPGIMETDSGEVDGLTAAPVAVSAGGQRSQRPTIQADTRLNAIIVQDIPSRIPIYQALVEQLDQPTTLIEIEAMIVDVNADLARDLGINWGAVNGNVSSGYGDLGLSPSGGLPISSAAAAAPGLIGLSVGNTLTARLRALASQGEASILSQPAILTGDNLEALIDLSETFYIQTLGERVATVTPVTVGTSLRVTPRYIPLGPEGPKVELTVDIEDGSIQNSEVEQVGGLPRVRKSNISTLAVVGDTQTLLIGGYNSTQQSEMVSKVPLLGDIPGLGLLFSSRSKAWQRRERLFLIRPHVVAVDGRSVAPALSREDQARKDKAIMDVIKQDRQASQSRQRQMAPNIEPAPDPAMGRFEGSNPKTRDWWKVKPGDADYWDSSAYR